MSEVKEKLPTGPRRIAELVRRSRPKTEKPDAGAVYEKIAAAADETARGCYATLEDIDDRLSSILERIDADESIVVAIEEEEPSLVHAIEELSDELRAVAAEGSAPQRAPTAPTRPIPIRAKGRD